MTSLIAVLLALARPIEVLEEWEMISHAPLVESVTARGIYRRDDGPNARLPDAVQGSVRPQVFTPGNARDLPVQQGASGWEVAIPPGDGSTVRIVSRLTRPVGYARMFRLQWPAITPATVPTRRVIQVDRKWVIESGDGWSCTDDGEETIPCVTDWRTPSQFEWRVAPKSSPRAWIAGALLSLLIAGFGIAMFGNPEKLRERAVGALGGAVVGLSVAMGLAGALALTWVTAIVVAGVPFVVLGGVATRRRAGVVVGSVLLFAMPLVVMFDGRLRDLLTGTMVSAIGLLVAAIWPEKPSKSIIEQREPNP